MEGAFEDAVYISGNIGTISQQDAEAYWQEVFEAWKIYLDREAVRHGLWKRASAGDQGRQIKAKIDRALRSLELVEQLKVTEEDARDSILEELDDIINYAVFMKRIVKGTVETNV
jgi:hypothetical protein